MQNDKILKWYDKHGLPRPAHIEHGKEEDLRDKFEKMHAKSWRQEGNKLIATTPAGEVVNYLPTDVMLKGTDEDNNPILEKIQLM